MLQHYTMAAYQQGIHAGAMFASQNTEAEQERQMLSKALKESQQRKDQLAEQRAALEQQEKQQAEELAETSLAEEKQQHQHTEQELQRLQSPREDKRPHAGQTGMTPEPWLLTSAANLFFDVFETTYIKHPCVNICSCSWHRAFSFIKLWRD